MGLLDEVFGFKPNVFSSGEIPSIFPLPVLQVDFIKTDVTTIYSKILTDALERVDGLTEEQLPLLWDNCVKSAKGEGLITLLARAMAEKAELYIVYDKTVNVVRVATTDEQIEIKADYEKLAKSSKGVYISFTSYKKSDMVKLYSSLEYSTIEGLNRMLNVSAAIQMKFKKLRESVSLIDSIKAETQGQDLARALSKKQPIMIDADDSVEMATPDLSATEKSIGFIAAKLGFYLGMPASYITGEQTGGIGSTGEADTKAIERGLKSYYYSILKPVLFAIFDATTSYKSQDTTNLTTGVETLKIFSMTDEELISKENKTSILNKIFDLPEDAEGDPTPKAVAPPVVPPTAVPAAPKAVPNAG